MAYTKHVSMLMGLAAMTAVSSVLPAHADMAEPGDLEASLASESFDAYLYESFDGADVEFLADAVDASAGESSEVSEAAAAPTDLQANALDTAASLNLDATTAAANIWVDETSLLAFQDADIQTALDSSTLEIDNSLLDSVELAQSTRTLYQGVSPFYVGVGGNIGIGNRDETGVASFGFNVISKIGLGPRFALRPSMTVTNQSTSFVVPLTYNFNVFDAFGFRMQPYVGAGVDIPTGADIGLVLDAGVDVPISRDFTLNAVSNFRVTGGFGLGISIGVGYNFPFFFE